MPQRAHMEVRGQLCGVSAILSSFTKVPGIELKSLDLCSKHLYLLSSLANPLRQVCFCDRVSLLSLSCPGIHYIDQTDFKCTEIL